MTRRILCGTVAAVAACLAAGAFAAGTLKDPRKLVLQKSDFPAGVHVLADSGVVAGSRATTYTVHFNFRVGSREEEVESDVAVAKDRNAAETVYKLTVAGYTGKVVPLKGETVLQLPAYGDEQSADFFSTPTRPHGQVIVRKNTVVWYLTVEDCGVYSPASCVGRTPPPITKAQALAELKRYAPKQKALVGSG